MTKLTGYFSLNELDKTFEKWVDFDGGVFFEAGAADGVSYSNTAHFEFDRGWTGILVEPVPHQYEKAVANRPNSQCVHAALVSDDFPDDEIEMTYCGLMTVALGEGRVWDAQTHVDKGIPILTRRNETTYNFKAPTRTISSILDQCGVSHIDLMSLDVEGFEVNALKGLDFSRHTVDFFCMEAKGGRSLPAIMGVLSDDRYEVVELMAQYDYVIRRRGMPKR